MFSAGQSRDPKPCSGTIIVTRHCPLEMRQRSSWSIEQFVVAKKLGGGYASTVHLAVCKASGVQVAIKVYHRCKLSQLNNYQVHREIRIHSCLDHKNVLQLYAAFEDEVGIYLVTEYASRGDVFGELDRRGGTMTEADAVCQVLSPFLSALEYLHMLNIIHRDIKPENLLFTAAGVLKVADFGLSIDITQERPVTRVGTLDYMAPEVVICPDKCHPNDHKEKTHLHYTYLVDAWAVGVLAYELTVGRAPFDAGNKRGTIDNILNAQPRFPAWISDSCRHFVTFSLTKDPLKRPGIKQLGDHPWVHQHAGSSRLKPPVQAGRAVSFHSLSMYIDPAVRGGGPQAAQRLKIHEVAPGSEVLAEGPEDDELFVSATGEPEVGAAAMEGVTRPAAATAAAASSCGAANVPDDQQRSSSSSCTMAKSGTANTNSPLMSGGNTVTTESPVSSISSPFAAAAHQPAPVQQQQQAVGSSSLLGVAADKLRAFVHRCQSANDIDSLRAFMMMQPPEPSNACFEPGGRFYNSAATASAKQQQQHGSHAPVAAAAGAKQDVPSHHDSAASLGCHFSNSSSNSSSRLADLSRPPSSCLSNGSQHQQQHQSQQHLHQQQGLGRPLLSAMPLSNLSPKPLQLVKLTAPGGLARSDSCKSLQGPLSPLVEKDSAFPNEANLLTIQGTASTSPMATSPVAHQNQPSAHHQMPSSSTFEQLATEQRRSPPSVESSEAAAVVGASSSSSSSCESGVAAGSSGSVSSCNSWGYQQQQQQQPNAQVQPPVPASPPCLNSKTPPACGAFTVSTPCTGSAGPAAAVGVAGQAVGKGSCHDLDQLLTVCRPGHAVPVHTPTAAASPGKAMTVTLSVDCRSSAMPPTSPLGQSPQGAAALGLQEQHPLLPSAAGVAANSCFGFLKSTRK